MNDERAILIKIHIRTVLSHITVGHSRCFWAPTGFDCLWDRTGLNPSTQCSDRIETVSVNGVLDGRCEPPRSFRQKPQMRLDIYEIPQSEFLRHWLCSVTAFARIICWDHLQRIIIYSPWTFETDYHRPKDIIVTRVLIQNAVLSGSKELGHITFGTYPEHLWRAIYVVSSRSCRRSVTLDRRENVISNA